MLPFRLPRRLPRLSRSSGHLCPKPPICLHASRLNVPKIASFSTSPKLYTKQVVLKAPQLFTYDGSHGILREFSAKVGDRISKDQEIGEIDTIKLIYEIESPAKGILSQLLASPGDEIRSFQDVAMLEVDDMEECTQGAERQQPNETEKRNV
ncbi:hypothetical protein NQ176_g10173 [Zarea fungicola]|uniref:Uncharacterized protein n=1 Tax=Zarea fungicola TaxID=93591 RepID=A0ACC1MHG9_9HYPO|nr:hypothetical protein NQ176_g10173 [Lecanicillium fungicola]